MRITILVSGFPPYNIGGTEIATKNIAKYLSDKGHDVHVIYPSNHNIECLYGTVCLHPVKISSTPLSFTYPALKIERVIKSDVVHAQGLFMGFPALVIKKLFGIPYVVYGRGSDVYTDYKNKSFTLKLILDNANAIISLTEHMKKEIQKSTNKEIYVIPNGIEYNRFKRDVFCNNHTIVYVGGLRQVKGIQYLIESMKTICETHKDSLLFVAGAGKECSNLRNLVEMLGLRGRVVFLGNVPNDIIPYYMSQSSVFVLPSLSEGFPVTILEAMATGLPVVATNVKGVPEIVEDNINGFLVKPKRPEEIAEKVLELFSNSDLRNRMSRNNIEKAKQYSWDNVVQKLEEVYEGTT